MVVILPEVSRTLNEYLLLPNLTTEDCTPDNVDLQRPVVRHRVGEESPLRIAVPLTSAIMQAVSSPELAIALAQCGGLSFIHHEPEHRRPGRDGRQRSSGTRPASATATSTSSRPPPSAS